MVDNDLVEVFKKTISLSGNTKKLQIAVKEIICDNFFDKLVNFLSRMNEQSRSSNDLRTLISFYKVIAQNLPACDIAHEKVSALLHMTYIYMINKRREIHEIYLFDRIEELLLLTGGKKCTHEDYSFLYTDLDIYPSSINIYKIRSPAPNKIEGSYRNSEEYLDIQFKLLREDFFCALRDGLVQIKMENTNIKTSPHFYIYKNVKSIKLQLNQKPSSKICHWLKFSRNDEFILRNENWDISKKFMNGSLLFFTDNNFTTFFVAVVETNVCAFTKGHRIELHISVIGNPYQLKVGCPYDMIEPRIFFEPYYQSLKVLQGMNPHVFPLAEDIILLSHNIIPSSFGNKLRSSNINGTLSGSIRYEANDLNKSQSDALNAALLQKFTLIQGPPGTGKSHLCRKIISILSEDASDTRPILVICMRNRALDKILEPLAKSGLNIIRFGRTETESLKKFSFFNWKRKIKAPKSLNEQFLSKKISSFRKVINNKNNVNKPEAVDDAFEHHQKACAAYRLLCDYHYAHNLQTANIQVIGATTTGAAKHYRLLCEINPKTVIIEEAAEILEPFLITSLPSSCDHLILIGDHLQLQPITSWHLSGVKYKLNISLFERLIKNGKSYHCLTVQHRMRPEIAELICPLIYDNVTNHPSVHEYPDIIGVDKNVFFVTHSKDEEYSSDTLSYSNPHEAKFLLSLANYLLKQGYSCSEITILSAYSAQQNYLIENVKKYPLLEGIQIFSIDNYQGDENEIILLSLVRSNGHSIGFLRQSNRVNVALSRARAGLYIIGNSVTLSRHGGLWSDIFNLLKSRNSFGKSIPLKCKLHQQLTHVNTPEAIDNLSLGGCNRKCNLKMECGHICELKCHPSLHDGTFCTKPCQRKVCNEHYCNKLCNEECGPCMKNRSFTLDCGHTVVMECSADIANYKCTKPCKRKVCEKHYCDKLCHEECGPCTKKSRFSLDCGHIADIECSADIANYKCTKPCTRKVCSEHYCKKLCNEECGPCMKNRSFTLDCGHTVVMECSANIANYICTKPCKRKPCGKHDCRRKCFEKCTPCKQKVMIELECGHFDFLKCSSRIDPKSLLCFEPCNRSPCGRHKCKKQCFEECEPCRELLVYLLPCGHKVERECHLGLNNYKCTMPCNKTKLPCGRHKCKKQCYEECGPCRELLVHFLPCGHILERECHLGLNNYKCTKPCNKIRSCGFHYCSETCHRFSCLPCEETILKERICGHKYYAVCGEGTYYDVCTMLVSLKYAKCPHMFQVFCYQRHNVNKPMCEDCKNSIGFSSFIYIILLGMSLYLLLYKWK